MNPRNLWLTKVLFQESNRTWPGVLGCRRIFAKVLVLNERVGRTFIDMRLVGLSEFLHGSDRGVLIGPAR